MPTPHQTASEKIPRRTCTPEERAARIAWMLKHAREIRGY